MDHRSVVVACVGLLAIAGAGFYLTGNVSSEPSAPEPSPVRIVRGASNSTTIAPASQQANAPPAIVVPLITPASVPAQPIVADPDDPIAAGLLPPDREDSPHRMYARLRAEVRDARWAAQTERALRQEFAALPHVGTPGNPLRSRCGVTICEVSGTLQKGLQMSEANAAMEALQGQQMHTALGRHGLQQASAMFSSDATGRSTFVMYSMRKQ